MVIIILVLFILMFIGSYKLNRTSKLANRFILFVLIIWFFCLFFSKINIYGINKVSDSTYFLLLLNVLSFCIGFCSVKTLRDNNNNNICLDYILESAYFKIILCFSLAVSLHMFTTQFKIIAMSGLGLVRESFWEIMFENQPFWLAFSYTFILQSFFFFIIPFIIYCIEHRKYLLQLIMMILFAFSFSFIAGGRVRFLFIGIGVLLYFFARYMLPKPKKGSAKIVLIFLGCVLLAVTAMSTLRAGEAEVTSDNLSVGMEKNLKQLIIYNTGSFVALDKALNSESVTSIGGPFLFRATFGGFEEFMAKILGKIGINFSDINEKTVYRFQDEELYIGGDITFNYAYTNVIFHYYDLGVLGVFLFPFLGGLFVKKIINKMNRNSSPFLLSLLCFLLCVAYNSTFTLLIIKPFAIIYILFLLYLDKQYTKKANKIALNQVE